MSGLDFLDLVIGLIFIYLIYSIACSTLWEILISFSHLRGKMLFRWIYNSFGDKESDLGKLIANHPMIKGLTRKADSLPSYISSNVFTDVLLDLISSKAPKSEVLHFDISMIEKKLEETDLLNNDLKRVFLQYFSEAEGKLNVAKERISKWYDEAQERLLGAYKKKLQWWIFVISLVLVGVTNADTFKLSSYLYNNDEAREAIANKASLYVQDSSVVRLISAIDTAKIAAIGNLSQDEIVKKMAKDFETIKSLDKELKQAEIPIGWKNEKIDDFWDYVKKIGGLLLTALAVSMGSPFWFDMLSKLVNLRSSGVKPASTLNKKPDDQK
jgi:hypothetical protein